MLKTVSQNNPTSLISRSPKNQYVVSLKERINDKEDLQFLQQDGFRHIETFAFNQQNFPALQGDMVLVELRDEANAVQALNDLSQDPRIRFIEPDREFELQEVPEYKSSLESAGRVDDASPAARKKPNDLSARQWGLDSSRGTDIDAPEAWASTVGSRSDGPIIAVIDTGVETDHPDLRDNLWVNSREIPGNGRDDDGNGVIDDVHGFDAYFQDGEPEDAHGHGTHCAGILGATGNNRRGVTGVNWQARIMPIKIFDNSAKPKTSTSAILRGVAYAANNGARLTSNSWGSGGASRSIRQAFSSSRAFHFMGAGNDSQDNDSKPFYPASYGLNNSLSVAAVDKRGKLSSFSNFGEKSVDLAAPGSSIYSTVPGGRYGTKSGTSMATPFVTGVAGLLLSAAPGLTNGQLRQALLEGVVPNSDLAGKTVTGGVVNAKNSLARLGGR